MFHKALKILKHASTSKLPIKVRRVKLNGLDGSCEKKEKHFLILINKELPENHSVDVLIHEVAHVDAWGKTKKEDIHGDKWGICYSRLYRIWEKHLEEHS